MLCWSWHGQITVPTHSVAIASEHQLTKVESQCQSKEEHNQKLQSRVQQLKADKESITRELTVSVHQPLQGG